MVAKWFVQHQGKVYGPLDAMRLRKLAHAKKIQPESLLAQTAKGPWVNANQVRGLFDGLASRLNVEATDSQSVRGVSTEPKVWFYKSSTEVHGPLTEVEMQALEDGGVVKMSTLVLKVGETRWETAFSAGLFIDDTIEEQNAAKAGVASPQGDRDGGPEEVLWDGRPSHAINTGFYTLCALTSPLIFPALAGLRRYVSTDTIRYQITNRRVRIRTGLISTGRTYVRLQNITDARLKTPFLLTGTRYCNVELYGNDPRRPIAVLQGVPVAESALVISLCEAGARRHIPVAATNRIIAAAQSQDFKKIHDEQRKHAAQIKGLTDALIQDRLGRPPEFEPPPPKIPPVGQSVQPPESTPPAGDALWKFFCRGAISFIPVPVPVTRRRQPVSQLTAITATLGRRWKRTVHVKGHYRGKKWVAAHDREISG